MDEAMEMSDDATEDVINRLIAAYGNDPDAWPAEIKPIALGEPFSADACNRYQAYTRQFFSGAEQCAELSPWEHCSSFFCGETGLGTDSGDMIMGFSTIIPLCH